MRRFMHPRLPASLATAILVAGCVVQGPPTTVPPGGGGKKGPVSYEGKVKKVDALTRAISLEKNDGIKRASESIQKLIQALAGVMAGPQAMPASAARYQLNRTLYELGDASARATYDLAGMERMGNATLVYDDDTKELTGIVADNAEITFKFVNNGRRRSWEATIVRSPDKTTGTFFVEVEGGWTSQPSFAASSPVYAVPYCPPRPSVRPTKRPASARPLPATPYPSGYWTPGPYNPDGGPHNGDPNGWTSPTPYAYPSYTPGPSWYPSPSPTAWATTPPPATPSPSPMASGGLISNNAGGYAITQFGGPMPAPATPYATDYGDGYQDDGYQDDYGYEDEYRDPACDNPQPAWTPPPPPPFKVFGGEYPNVVSSVAVKLDVIPQGDKSLAFSFAGKFDEPEAMPGQTFLVPTHWKLNAKVPKVKLDWESRFHMDPGKNTFKADGSMTVEGGADGDDTFKFAGSFDEAAKDIKAQIAHVDAGVKLVVEGKMGTSKPDKLGLYATDTDEKLGDVEPDNSRPGVVVITMLKDGQKIDWQLLPSGGMFPFMMAPPPVAPVATRKSPKPGVTPVEDFSTDGEAEEE